VEDLGFEQVRASASHEIYEHPSITELVNVQEVKGQAKQYQSAPVAPADRTARSPAGGPMKSDYHINVVYSEENGGYIADIPELQACSAFAEDPRKAVSEVLVAKEA